LTDTIQLDPENPFLDIQLEPGDRINTTQARRVFVHVPALEPDRNEQARDAAEAAVDLYADEGLEFRIIGSRWSSSSTPARWFLHFGLEYVGPLDATGQRHVDEAGGALVVLLVGAIIGALATTAAFFAFGVDDGDPSITLTKGQIDELLERGELDDFQGAQNLELLIKNLPALAVIALAVAAAFIYRK